MHTLENMTFTVTPLFEALTNESSATKAAPKGGQMQGFSYTGAVGDVIYWDITGETVSMDFYDAEGNPITPVTENIEGKDVLAIELTTTAVYLLTYGATADGEITVQLTKKVADGIREVVTTVKPVNVYTLGGVLVRRGATTLDGLSDGVYIINGKKVYVRRKR